MSKKKAGFDFKFSIQEGWVQLPVLDNPDKFAHDRKVQAWSERQARAMLGEDAGRDQLRERPTSWPHRPTRPGPATPHTGWLYSMPTAPGPLAFLDVLRGVPDRHVYPELTFDALREVYATDSAGTLGAIDTQQVELPSGPALRVRRQRAEPGDPTGQSTVMEGVTYAIRPPGINDAIVVTMTWAALQYGDRLAKMADAIARSVQVTLT
jgi:hypothetical protein